MKKVWIKTIILAIAIFLAIAFSGCNAIARQWGGTTTVNLEPGRKFVDITWKDNSLWVLTKEMDEGDTAETYYFEEDANFGILEGTVIIVEHNKSSYD